jgi:hypothetical protein
MPKSTATDGGVVRQSASKVKSKSKSKSGNTNFLGSGGSNVAPGPDVVEEVNVTTPFPVVDFFVVTLPSTIVIEPKAELDSPPVADELVDTDALPEPLTVTEPEARAELEEVAASAAPGRRRDPPIARALVPRTASRPEGRIALRTCFISSSCE